MLLSEIYNLIGRFTISVVSSGVTVIYANQSAPRPTKPFVTIAIKNLRQIGWPSSTSFNVLGFQEKILQKRFVIEFQAYSDILHGAEDILNDIENQFMTDYAYRFFNSYLIFENSIAYNRTILGVKAIPIGINGENESRAILEAEFLVNQEIFDNVGLIEHIEINDVTQNQTYIIDK